MPDVIEEIWGPVLEATRREVRDILDRAWETEGDAADMIARWHIASIGRAIKTVVLEKGRGTDEREVS